MSGQNTSSYNHTSGWAEIETARERENERKEGGVQGGKVEEEMRTVRNNERVGETEEKRKGGGDVLQIVMRKGRPIHSV